MSTAVKKWTPTHDYIIALALAGRRNKEIAQIVGRSEGWVSKVLRDPDSQMRLKEAQGKIVENVVDGIRGRLLKAAQTGIGRIEETLNQPIPVNSKYKMHQDKVALDILKGTGFLRNEHEAPKKAEQVTEGTAKRLVQAMEKSNEVAKLHKGNVIDAEFEVMNEKGSGERSEKDFEEVQREAPTQEGAGEEGEEAT